MANPIDNSASKTPCVARKHISAAAFKTYDCMLAMAKAGQEARKREGKPAGDLIFSGKLTTLANRNNRNKDAESDAVKELEKDYWIIPLQDKHGDIRQQRRNKRAGTFATFEYRVVEHDEYAKNHAKDYPCPPDRYDEDGNPIKRGKLPLNLLRCNLRRVLGEDWIAEHDPGFFNSLTADGIRAINGLHPFSGCLRAVQVPDDDTVTGKSVAVAVTENSVAVEAKEEPLRKTPSRTVTENSVTRFASLPVKKACLPSCLPSDSTPNQTPEGRTDGRMEGFSKEKPPTKDEELLEYKAEMDAELEKALDNEFQKLLSNIPEVMRGAVFGKHEKQSLREQINRNNREIVLKALNDWITNRELPIEDRKFGKWKCWFDECAPFIKKARDDVFEANERRSWSAKWKEVDANGAISKEALQHGRKFIESEWSYGDSDKNTLREMSDEVKLHQAQGLTLPLDRLRYQDRFLQDLLERFKVWNVVCNGTPIPTDYSEEEWSDELDYVRNDIAKKKAKLSGK